MPVGLLTRCFGIAAVVEDPTALFRNCLPMPSTPSTTSWKKATQQMPCAARKKTPQQRQPQQPALDLRWLSASPERIQQLSPDHMTAWARMDMRLACRFNHPKWATQAVHLCADASHEFVCAALHCADVHPKVLQAVLRVHYSTGAGSAPSNRESDLRWFVQYVRTHVFLRQERVLQELLDAAAKLNVLYKAVSF